MLNYGAYAQTYFVYNTESLANADLEAAEKAVSSVTDLSAYLTNAVAIEGAGSFVGASLTLKTETILVAYFDLADGVDINTLTFKANGNTVTPEKSGEYYLLKIEGLSASKLDDDIVFTVEGKEGSFTCDALSYCARVLNDDTAADALKDVVRAIYLYNLAANAYAN